MLCYSQKDTPTSAHSRLSRPLTHRLMPVLITPSCPIPQEEESRTPQPDQQLWWNIHTYTTVRWVSSTADTLSWMQAMGLEALQDRTISSDVSMGIGMQHFSAFLFSLILCSYFFLSSFSHSSSQLKTKRKKCSVCVNDFSTFIVHLLWQYSRNMPNKPLRCVSYTSPPWESIEKTSNKS